MTEENKQGRNAAENAVSSVGNLQENEKEITFAKSLMRQQEGLCLHDRASIGQGAQARRVYYKYRTLDL